MTQLGPAVDIFGIYIYSFFKCQVPGMWCYHFITSKIQ